MILQLDEDDLDDITDATPGDWRTLLTVDAIETACDQADAKVARVETLIEEVGVHAVVEALRRRGTLVRP
jgi:hypothetical protein